jgi:hypothetical protein
MAKVGYGTVRSCLNQSDWSYFNRALKDICANYKGTRDYKVKSADGGNFHAIPHRIGDSITDLFSGSAWPYWYATVALNSPASSGVGKRRLIIRILDQRDYGVADQIIYTPTHYGDQPKSGVDDFTIITDLTLNKTLSFNYKGSNYVDVPMPAVAVVTTSVAVPTVDATPVPATPDPESFVPDFIKELRRLTGESFFSGTPDQFFNPFGAKQ